MNFLNYGMGNGKKETESVWHILIILFRCFGEFHLSSAGIWDFVGISL